MPEIAERKEYDQIAAEAAQHAEECAGKLDRHLQALEDEGHGAHDVRWRVGIAKLAAHHARRCADEARKTLQEGQPLRAQKYALEALADAFQAEEAAKMVPHVLSGDEINRNGGGRV